MIKSPIRNVISNQLLSSPILEDGGGPPDAVFWVDDLGNDMVDEAGNFLVFEL